MKNRRSWVALLIFTLVIINYIDRIALSVASKSLVSEFGLTPVELGYLLSGFLWTYVLCLIPLGLVVERVGPKTMVGGGIAIWSAATALTAVASGFVTILGCRLLMGASEATSFPACGRIIREWFPARERGLVTTLFNGGSTAGPAVGAIISAVLIDRYGWQACFIILGILGFVWFFFWSACYGPPETVSWLSASEKKMILAERNGDDPTEHEEDPPASSLLYLLSKPSTWGLVVTQACLVYTAYLFLTWLPTFLQSTRNLSTMNTGYLTAIPYFITMVLGLCIARASDRMLSAAAITAGKRRNFIAAMAILALLIVMAPFVTDLWELLAVLTLVLTGSTTGAGLNFTLASDLIRNPRDVSRTIAITAFGGNLFGLIAPIITGYIVSMTGGYDMAFYVAAALLLLGAVTTLLMTQRPIDAEFARASALLSKAS